MKEATGTERGTLHSQQKRAHARGATHQGVLRESCAISVSWFYKWLHREPTPDRGIRRRELNAAVKAFLESVQAPPTGSPPDPPRFCVEAGWTVSAGTPSPTRCDDKDCKVGNPKRRKGLTRQDTSAPKFPDRLKRDFTAGRAEPREWCGDMTEISADRTKLPGATVLDLFSRKLLASPTSDADAGSAW